MLPIVSHNKFGSPPEPKAPQCDGEPGQVTPPEPKQKSQLAKLRPQSTRTQVKLTTFHFIEYRQENSECYPPNSPRGPGCTDGCQTPPALAPSIRGLPLLISYNHGAQNNGSKIEKEQRPPLHANMLPETGGELNLPPTTAARDAAECRVLAGRRRTKFKT
ncbi:hypothetical protein B0H14DRAFT_2575891 [Mycena olivaceomarginata]|nr:hypothetical protein B0H14DRAFT_2575891 [Mycena olivaceomarginata]